MVVHGLENSAGSVGEAVVMVATMTSKSGLATPAAMCDRR